MYILLWHKTIDNWDPLTHIGILDFHGQLQRNKKTRFCCRGHLLPTVKMNMYTDIDIFKTRHQLFLFEMIKKEWKEEMNSGKLWRSCWEDRGGCGHTKTGHGSQRQAQGGFNITTIFAYISEMGMDSGTSGHVTQRGKILDKEAEL